MSLKEIKKYTVGFIIGLSLITGISYAANYGSIGSLFDNISTGNPTLNGANISNGTISEDKFGIGVKTKLNSGDLSDVCDTNNEGKINKTFVNGFQVCFKYPQYERYSLVSTPTCIHNSTEIRRRTTRHGFLHIKHYHVECSIGYDWKNIGKDFYSKSEIDTNYLKNNENGALTGNLNINGKLSANGGNASGNYSTAIGVDTNASGHYSTAIGMGTQATNYYSIAIGHRSEATNFYGLAVGEYVRAKGVSSMVFGKGYEGDSFDTYLENDTSDSFAIGYMNSAVDTKPEFKVKDGEVSIDGDLKINGNITANSIFSNGTCDSSKLGKLSVIDGLIKKCEHVISEVYYLPRVNVTNRNHNPYINGDNLSTIKFCEMKGYTFIDTLSLQSGVDTYGTDGNGYYKSSNSTWVGGNPDTQTNYIKSIYCARYSWETYSS